MTVDDLGPLTVAQLRDQVSAIRDGAVERLDMSQHDRGRIAGTRAILDVVLAMIDRVECTCPPPERPTTGGLRPVPRDDA